MLNLRDYVRGDDVTDVSAGITQALSDAAASGDMLYWPKDDGAYMCGSTVTLPANVTILAEPGAVVKALANEPKDYFPILATSSASNIRIYNLTIDGNSDNATVAGLQFYSCSDLVVEGCTFQNTRGIAINLSTGIVNARIQHNRFHRTGDPDAPRTGGRFDCSSVVFGEGSAGNSHTIFVTDNIFEDVGLGCVTFENCDDVLVRGNYSKRSTAGFIYTNPGVCRRFRIEGNYSEAEGLNLPPYSNGFDLLNLADSVIIGNISYGNGACGIGLFSSQNITVVGNICNNNHQDAASGFTAGIWIRNNDGLTKRIILVGNSCTDTQSVKTQGYGLVYDPGIEGLVVDESNDFAGNGTAEIGIANGTDLTVVSNRKLYMDPIAPTLLNSWVNYPGALPSGYYKNQANVVTAVGGIKDGTTTPGTVLFNLPVGYRPPFDIAFPCASVGYGGVTVKQNGNVQLDAGSATFLSLQGISFRAA
jgi:parallel beta-helix repeat protein